MNNEVICALPFLKIYNHLSARSYTPCCWSSHSSDEKNPTNTLPIEHFYGEEFSRLRKEMLEGKKTEFLYEYCRNCWKNEEEFGHSQRLNQNSLINDNILKNFNLDGTVKENSSRFIRVAINVYGNHCNLECYECLPSNSSSRIRRLLSIGDDEVNKLFLFDPKKVDENKVSKEQFEKIVDEIILFSHKINTITVVGGEPMVMKSHFNLLDRLIECGQSKNIELDYVSNMTLMNLSSMKKYFDNFKYTSLQWSVDALGDRNEWLRYPTNWKETIKNCEEVRSYFLRENVGWFKSTITPSLFSITTFKETFDWMLINDFTIPDKQHSNFVDHPVFLSPQHLPQELKELIKDDVKKISKVHYNQLMANRDENMFQLAIRYADSLDQQRGTDWRSTFPEIAKYAN